MTNPTIATLSPPTGIRTASPGPADAQVDTLILDLRQAASTFLSAARRRVDQAQATTSPITPRGITSMHDAQAFRDAAIRTLTNQLPVNHRNEALLDRVKHSLVRTYRATFDPWFAHDPSFDTRLFDAAAADSVGFGPARELRDRLVNSRVATLRNQNSSACPELRGLIDLGIMTDSDARDIFIMVFENLIAATNRIRDLSTTTHSDPDIARMAREQMAGDPHPANGQITTWIRAERHLRTHRMALRRTFFDLAATLASPGLRDREDIRRSLVCLDGRTVVTTGNAMTIDDTHLLALEARIERLERLPLPQRTRQAQTSATALPGIQTASPSRPRRPVDVRALAKFGSVTAALATTILTSNGGHVATSPRTNGDNVRTVIARTCDPALVDVEMTITGARTRQDPLDVLSRWDSAARPCDVPGAIGPATTSPSDITRILSDPVVDLGQHLRLSPNL